MLRFAALLIFSLVLASCDALNTLTDGFSNANAVASDLEQSTGVKPFVGFDWHNGRLTSVTVTFPRLLETKPLRELAEATRASVTKQFKQTPGAVVLAFSLGK